MTAKKTTAKPMTAEQIIAKTAEFVKREADTTACCIPMRDRGYVRLVGQDFMVFFSKNQIGESAQYKWETRHVDQLCNLWIWHK
jgi:hypothetical protein